MKKLILVVLLSSVCTAGSLLLADENCDIYFDLTMNLVSNGAHDKVVKNFVEMPNICKLDNLYLLLYYAWTSDNPQLTSFVDENVLKYHYYNDLNLAEQLAMYCVMRGNDECFHAISDKLCDKYEVMSAHAAHHLLKGNYKEVLNVHDKISESERVLGRELMIAAYKLGKGKEAREIADQFISNELYPSGLLEKELTILLSKQIKGESPESIRREIIKSAADYQGLRDKYLKYSEIISK